MRKFLVVMASAAATILAPAAALAEETSYAKLGRWSVAAATDNSKLSYCTADVDNGRVQLRLATTDGTSWRVGVPYYNNRKTVPGFYGFGDASEQATFKVSGDGWAYIAINGDQLNAFRTNPEFSINLDRGLQTWRLADIGPAIGKAVECARNGGKPGSVAQAQPQPAPAPTATPAPGSTPAPAPAQINLAKITDSDLSKWSTSSSCSFALYRNKDLVALFDTQDAKKTALFKIDGKLVFAPADLADKSAYWVGNAAGQKLRMVKGRVNPAFKNDGGSKGGEGRVEWNGPAGQGGITLRWEEGC